MKGLYLLFLFTWEINNAMILLGKSFCEEGSRLWKRQVRDWKTYS